MSKINFTYQRWFNRIYKIDYFYSDSLREVINIYIRIKKKSNFRQKLMVEDLEKFSLIVERKRLKFQSRYSLEGISILTILGCRKAGLLFLDSSVSLNLIKKEFELYDWVCLIKGKQSLNYYYVLGLDLRINKRLTNIFLFPWKIKFKKNIWFSIKVSNFCFLAQENRDFFKKRVINYRPIFIYYVDRNLIMGIKFLKLVSFPVYINYWVNRVKGNFIFDVWQVEIKFQRLNLELFNKKYYISLSPYIPQLVSVMINKNIVKKHNRGLLVPIKVGYILHQEDEIILDFFCSEWIFICLSFQGLANKGIQKMWFFFKTSCALTFGIKYKKSFNSLFKVIKIIGEKLRIRAKQKIWQLINNNPLERKYIRFKLDHFLNVS